MEQTYNHHTITVTENFQFQVSGPMFDRPMTFDSADAAREKIDSLVRASQKAARAKLSLAVLSPEGQPATIRGINANTSKIVGVDPSVIAGTSAYPDVPWIGELVQELVKLKTRADEITRIIWPYHIELSRGYGRLGDAEYQRAIDKLTQEVQDRTERAQKSAPSA